MPSQVTDSYWISASRERGSYPAHTTRGGKWLVFVKSEHIDEFWLKIRDAVRDGQLGSSAKCSTAMPNPNATSSSHVICVYTHDAKDSQDVRRVRAGIYDQWVKKSIGALGQLRPVRYAKTEKDEEVIRVAH